MDSKVLEIVHTIQLEILNDIVRICEKHKLTYFLISGTLLGSIRHGGFIPWDDDLDIAMPREDYTNFLKLCKTELNSANYLDDFTTNSDYSLLFAKIRRKNTIYEQISEINCKNSNRGIWVDIFPLDEVKHQKSLIQDCQARIVNKLRFNIAVKQKCYRPKNIKEKLSYLFISFFTIKQSFILQNYIMSLGNNRGFEYFVSFGSSYGHRKETMKKNLFYPLIKVHFEGQQYFAPRQYDYILTVIYGDYMTPPPENKRVTHGVKRIDFGSGV